LSDIDIFDIRRNPFFKQNDPCSVAIGAVRGTKKSHYRFAAGIGCHAEHLKKDKKVPVGKKLWKLPKTTLSSERVARELPGPRRDNRVRTLLFQTATPAHLLPTTVLVGARSTAQASPLGKKSLGAARLRTR